MRRDSDRLLRTIALFEAAKGGLVLLAGSGAFLLVHRDVQAMADRIVTHFHLNPAARTPRIFLRLATEATPATLRVLAIGAFAYALLRFAEAIGLWRGRRWAEWLGIASGLIYVPFEVAALLRHPGMEPLAALAVNVAIVAVLGARLRRA